MNSTIPTLRPLHAKQTARFTRCSWLLPVLIALSCGQCHGKKAKVNVPVTDCTMTPGTRTILVPLQNAPNSLEPMCQPARIRVPDRTKVTIRLTGLSPLDVCTLSSKPQTVTTVANPLETIINAVSGLKAFSLGVAPATVYETKTFTPPETEPKTPVNIQNETPEQKDARIAAQKKKADEAALAAFDALSESIRPTADDVFLGQRAWLVEYQKDVVKIAEYVAKDYRGTNLWTFQPETGGALADVRTHVNLPDAKGSTPLPTEKDYAKLQALVDQMSDLQKRLTTPCTAPGEPCDPQSLTKIETELDSAKAFVLVAQDNLKILQAAQATVLTAYTAVAKVYEDYLTRRDILKIVNIVNPQSPLNEQFLSQDIRLGPDYGATDTGSINCVSDAALTQATTDAITYSVLYQNVPLLTVSAGMLTTFLPKKIIGIQSVAGSSNTPTNYFKVTDSSRAQVFPMAFVNFRTPGFKLTTWPGQPENELVIANSVSAGIGINPNTGTNQAEFFVGDAVSFGRVYIHAGAHFGRTESLGGGFQLDTQTSGVTSAPINWNYHVAFSVGLSVRIAPF